MLAADLALGGVFSVHTVAPPLAAPSRKLLMPGTVAAESYADLLRRPDVARTFVPALVGRLASGALPLSLLFTVQHATGSFSTATGATALNGLASLTMPLKARAIDRVGQRLVVPAITCAMAATLAITAATARAAITSSNLWLAAGLAVGLASPPLGPCMRAQWRVLVPGDAIARAYSLDAVGEEALYLVGPRVTVRSTRARSPRRPPGSTPSPTSGSPSAPPRPAVSSPTTVPEPPAGQEPRSRSP